MVDTEKGVKIANRLRADFDIVESLGYTCIGTFLFGSQNYEIDTDESDIDTRAIVIPKFMDIVKGSEGINIYHKKLSGELINIIDIRLFIHYIKKQNPNFLETLFTHYRYINKDFSYYLIELFNKKEEIARYDTSLADKAALGCCISFCKSVLNSIEDSGDFSGKDLAHAIRYKDLVDSYLDGKPYEECLIPTHKQLIQDIKLKGNQFDNSFAKKLASQLIKNCNNLSAVIGDSSFNNNEIDSLFDNVIYNILRYQFTKEFNSEQ